MQTQAPKGQYRVIGLDPIDTLASPSGPLWKDFETFDEARDFADRNEQLYLWVYVYDDGGAFVRGRSPPSGLKRLKIVRSVHAFSSLVLILIPIDFSKRPFLRLIFLGTA
jgi:hypothetical protein